MEQNNLIPLSIAECELYSLKCPKCGNMFKKKGFVKKADNGYKQRFRCNNKKCRHEQVFFIIP